MFVTFKVAGGGFVPPCVAEKLRFAVERESIGALVGKPYAEM